MNNCRSSPALTTASDSARLQTVQRITARYAYEQLLPVLAVSQLVSFFFLFASNAEKNKNSKIQAVKNVIQMQAFDFRPKAAHFPHGRRQSAGKGEQLFPVLCSPSPLPNCPLSSAKNVDVIKCSLVTIRMPRCDLLNVIFATQH